MLVDYHTHTSFSADSHTAMADQCRTAIHKGIQQIAFTEHEDYNPKDAVSFFFKHADYMRELARCREEFSGQLVIRAGIEISEPHMHADRASAVLNAHDWDFVLGSLHWMRTGKITVSTGLESFISHTGNWQESFRNYYTEIVELARVGDFDVLAHLDYPARYNRKCYVDDYDIAQYEDIIREALRHIVARGKGIEINTNPWRRGLPDPNPPAKVVRWYRELGGEILTVGSDGHAPKDLGTSIDRALGIAREAGFTHIATFERRKPVFVEIGD